MDRDFYHWAINLMMEEITVLLLDPCDLAVSRVHRGDIAVKPLDPCDLAVSRVLSW